MGKDKKHTTILLDGRVVSAERRKKLKIRIDALKEKWGRSPQLAVLIVGDHLASQVYVRNKVKACSEVGILSKKIEIPGSVTPEEFLKTLHQVEDDPQVDGVLVQLPLPESLRGLDLGSLMNPEKDADGFTYGTLGRVLAGTSKIAPCTPQGVMSILEHYKISVEGLHAVVVGRSLIVGKPMSILLTEAQATVTLCHSRTKDLSSFTRNADLVVVAAGKKQFLGRADFRENSVVIDVGMHGSGTGNEVCGDVRTAELMGWAQAITPVPGGVGPMTITTLLENTVALAERRSL